MRAILTAFPQNSARVTLLKTGNLTRYFRDGQRLYITDVPLHMKALPAGILPEVRQVLALDELLSPFFFSEKVALRAGGGGSLKRYVDKFPGCQAQADDHNGNLVTVMTREGEALRLCWSCDNRHFLQGYRALVDTAAQNRREWILDYVRLSLRLPEGHQLTLPELFCWAVMNEVVGEFPADVARRFYPLPDDEALAGSLKEADIDPWKMSARQLVDKKAKKAQPAVTPDKHTVSGDAPLNIKPALRLQVDGDPAAEYMRRPKMIRLELPEYTLWVKRQPCCGCGEPSDDPHHIINHGFGGTATKACDLLVIPLCRRCHSRLHDNVSKWEEQNGSQLLWLARTLSRASGIGAIARA